MFYMLCAHQAEVVERVNLFVALNPVAYLDHLHIPFLKELADFTSGIYNALASSGYYEFLGPGWDQFSSEVCGHWYTKEICKALEAFKYSEFNNKYDYSQRLKLSSDDKPDGITIQQLAHFG
mmetsp:Transcript_29943/g.45796  ORF Transcript_29943/g.45796 Transcript_29943/m.45796 type:complete len:122 (-) Transcript_29943:389-754(-)